MDYTYEVITNEFGEILKRTDKNGLVAWIPMMAGNSDYEAYLNPNKVEHLTEIIPSEAKTK